MFVIKGVSFVLNRSALFIQQKADDSYPKTQTEITVSLRVLAEPNFYILSTISTKWPAWLEARQ